MPEAATNAVLIEVILNEKLRIPRFPCKIGRAEDNDIVIDGDRSISNRSPRHGKDATEANARHEWDALTGTGRPGADAVRSDLTPIAPLSQGSIHDSHVVAGLRSSGTLPVAADPRRRTSLDPTRYAAAGPQGGRSRR